MSISSPVRTRQLRGSSIPLQPGTDHPPRGEGAVIVARSLLLAAAAILVIATSNYFAYLIGRKQVAYEELRRQVDRVVQLIDHSRAEDDRSLTASKQRQDRYEQNVSSLTGLTTSTINGKTTATPDPPAAATPVATMFDDRAVTRPDHEVRLQPTEPSVEPATKHLDVGGSARKRSSRRHKPSVATGQSLTGPFAKQPGQSTMAISATPDAGAASQ